MSTRSSCSAAVTGTGIGIGTNQTCPTQSGNFIGLTYWCIIAIPHSFKLWILITVRLTLQRWENKNQFESYWIHKIRAAVNQHKMRRWTFNSLLFHYLFVTLFILLLTPLLFIPLLINLYSLFSVTNWLSILILYCAVPLQYKLYCHVFIYCIC